MDGRSISRRDLVLGAASCGVVGLPSQAQARAQAGLVLTVDGEASAALNEARRILAADGPVFVGDRVSTGEGARANLRLGRATELHLGEKTRLTIDRFLMEAGGTITLGAGALLADRTPGSATGALRVRSPYGLIAVRGTRFFAGPSNGVFGVFVVRGQVDVTAAGKRVSLVAGEGTDIARRGAAPTAAKVWGDARIRAALALVD